MGNLTILDPRRGLENKLRKVWKEFFDLSRWLLDNHLEVKFSFDNLYKYIPLPDWSDAQLDDRYRPKSLFDFIKFNHDYIDPDTGRLCWEAPLCPDAVEWLSFISKTALLTKLDGLYIHYLVLQKKNKKGEIRKYFYLKWFGIILGENIRKEKYEVKRLDRENDEPREWSFNKKSVSLGYLPIEFDDNFKKEIHNSQDLERYLIKAKNYKTIKKAQIFREIFYLFKQKWKEILILERLFPILRTKKKLLPYHEWRDSILSYPLLGLLGTDIVALRRLLFPEWEPDKPWYEDWVIKC